MQLQGKKITQEQVEIIDNLISIFETIHEDIEERGIDNIDFQDTKDSILGLAEDLSISFGTKNEKIFD